MKIQDVQGVFKGIDPREARRSDPSAEKIPRKDIQSEDGDILDVSLSARVSELSTDLQDTLVNSSDNLTVDRINEIQTRINSGFFDQPSTMNTIADRMLSFYGR